PADPCHVSSKPSLPNSSSWPSASASGSACSAKSQSILSAQRVILPPSSRGFHYCFSTGGSIMSWGNVPFVRAAGLVVAAFLFVVPQVLAGDKYPSPIPRLVYLHPAPPPIARAMPRTAGYSAVVNMPVEPPSKPFYVDLRGPDGQVRHFPVEGGPAA